MKTITLQTLLYEPRLISNLSKKESHRLNRELIQKMNIMIEKNLELQLKLQEKDSGN